MEIRQNKMNHHQNEVLSRKLTLNFVQKENLEVQGQNYTRVHSVDLQHL